MEERVQTYINGQTPIMAEALNAIQDAIIENSTLIDTQATQISGKASASALTAETTAREAAVTAEATARAAADTALTEEVDDVKSALMLSIDLSGETQTGSSVIATATGSAVSDQASMYGVSDFIDISAVAGFKSKITSCFGPWFGCAFYDSSKTFISGINASGAGISGIDVATIEFDIPSSAEYFRFTLLNTYSSNVYDYPISYVASLFDVMNDVDKLDDKFSEITTNSLNILPVSTKSTTVNNVNVNYADGVLELSGTANANGGRTTPLTDYFTLKTGSYTFSCAQLGLFPVYIQTKTGDNIIGRLDIDYAPTFTVQSDTIVYIGYTFVRGASYNMVLNLQLQVGENNTEITKPTDALINPDSIDVKTAGVTWFDNIVCVGDSLTYSQVFYAGGSRQAYVTYPEALGRITGATVTALATPGYSSKNWWNNYNSQIAGATNQLAIIYLGTNGGLTDTLSTDAPESDDPSEWNDTTNTGCYAKIIAAYRAIGAKVVLVKIYQSSGDASLTNDVITQCADRFGCGLVENEFMPEKVYHYYPDLSGANNVHYNDIGYSVFASKLSQSIANMNPAYLKHLIPANV